MKRIDLLVTNNRCATQNKKMEAVCCCFVLSHVLILLQEHFCEKASPELKLENLKHLKPAYLCRSHRRWIMRKCLACLKRSSYFQLGFIALSLLPTSLLHSHTQVKKYFFILIITGSVVQFHYFLHLILPVSKGIIKAQCQTTALYLKILSI